MNERESDNQQLERGYFVGQTWSGHAPLFEAAEILDEAFIVVDGTQTSSAEGYQHEVGVYGKSSMSSAQDGPSEVTSNTSVTVDARFPNEQLIAKPSDEAGLASVRNPDSLILSDPFTASSSKALLACEHPNCLKSGARYARRSHLTKHERYHTPAAQRPLVCDVCSKRWLFPKELDRHKKVVHNIRSRDNAEHPCLKCGRPFNRKDHLKRHQTSRNCIA